jgi:ribosomal protein S20
MKLSKTKLKQIIKEELEGSSRDEAINSLKGLAGVFDKIDQANQSGGAEWPYVPGKIVSPANSSAAWMMMAEEIEDKYYDELQHAIDMLEDKEGTNPHGSRAVEHARSIDHPMADELAAAMTRAVNITLPYMKSLVGSGSGMKENNMKLTKTKLKQIIKEEFENLKEGEQEDAELGRILANMVDKFASGPHRVSREEAINAVLKVIKTKLDLMLR